MQNTTIFPLKNDIVHDNKDYRDYIYNSLPLNAKKYYIQSKYIDINNIVSKFNNSELCYRMINMLRLYPFLKIKYVNENQLIQMIIDGKYKLFRGPGYYTKINLNDSISEPINIGNDIQFGPIKIIYVKQGTLRFGTNIVESKPMILGPGMHYFDDINIQISNDIISLSTDYNNKIIPINNAFSLIFIKTGYNGIVNKSYGELEILSPGIHFCESPDSFKTFVSIQQEIIRFGSLIKANNKFLTMDNIELSINASLFYKLVDVKKVFTTNIRDNDDLLDTLLIQSNSLLMTLIRSENFSNIGKKNMHKRLENINLQNELLGNNNNNNNNNNIAIAEPINPSAPPIELADVSIGFQSIVKDIEPMFKKRMQENFGDSFGFDIQYFRIENIEFADKQMQNKISELSMEFTKLTAQETTINIQRKVEIANAEREAQTQLIKIEAESKRKIIAAKAENEITINKNKTNNEISVLLNNTENNILIETTKAKTSVSELEAQINAKNKIVIADAESYAIEKVGNAQYEINEKNSKLPYSNIKIIAEAQRDALKGVNKVIYTNEQSMLLKPYMNLIEKEM